MKTTHHIYTAKRKVLWEIGSKLQELGDFKYLDILVIKKKHGDDYIGKKPNSYKELIELLKDYGSVYDFYEVETILHGAIGYDIILEE